MKDEDALQLKIGQKIYVEMEVVRVVPASAEKRTGVVVQARIAPHIYHYISGAGIEKICTEKE